MSELATDAAEDGPDPAFAATCEGLVQVYDAAAGAVLALRGIDAQFPRGTVNVIVGPSGAGKSTLLRLLACLERPVAGEIRIGGHPTSHLSTRARRRFASRWIGYVFQQPRKNLIHDLTVVEHVALAAKMRRGGTAARSGPEAGDLERAGLDPVAGRRPSALSAGEQQRLAFAMAVAGGPELVIADEPTAQLDPVETAQVVSVLPALAADGLTFVLASHDPLLIAAADHVLLVRDGCLAERSGADGEMLTVLDDIGRLQLPDALAADFAERVARITVVGDGPSRWARIERP